MRWKEASGEWSTSTGGRRRQGRVRGEARSPPTSTNGRVHMPHKCSDDGDGLASALLIMLARSQDDGLPLRLALRSHPRGRIGSHASRRRRARRLKPDGRRSTQHLASYARQSCDMAASGDETMLPTDGATLACLRRTLSSSGGPSWSVQPGKRPAAKHN
jgi:hypothetical protein